MFSFLSLSLPSSLFHPFSFRSQQLNSCGYVCVVATASVDVASDARIQSRIRSLCANATLLTIAHRLETVVDADRVLVLQASKGVECDSPASLLANPNSFLSSMAHETGVHPFGVERYVSLGGSKATYLDTHVITRTRIPSYTVCPEKPVTSKI